MCITGRYMELWETMFAECGKVKTFPCYVNDVFHWWNDLLCTFPYRNIGFGLNFIFSGVKSSMKVFIAVLFGLISAAVGIGFSFFNPGMGPVMSISIIGAGIIYALWQKKDS